MIRSFNALVDGVIDDLRIAVVLDSTRATRSEPSVGVWRLDRDRFLLIARSIAEREKKTRDRLLTVAEVALWLEESGVENRLFRLDEQVAKWLDETDPDQSVDYACA